ncbi:MAG: endolytic transglycosylase MltG [Myxococcota bacterium]
MFALLLTLLACVDPDAPVNPGDDTELVFEVPKGATANGIAPKLEAEGLIPGAMSWKMFLRSADASCLKAGRFKVRRSMSLNELLETLCGAPLADEAPFTIVEGWRIRDIDAALAATGRMEAGAYAAVVNAKGIDLPFDIPGPTLEGYLYPETYMIPSEGDIDPKKLVQRQVETFRDRFVAKHPEGFGSRSLHEVVIMASMLEREEPKPSQRPMVAGILWKRIDGGWALGVDATSRYELPEWNDRKAFLKKLRDEEDAYNTRHKKGLPPTPIGNPSVESLEAAMAPVESEFWYYLHDAQGTIHPAKDANGHEANRRKYNVY